MARAGDAGRPIAVLQLKALETLALREIDSTPILRGLLDARRCSSGPTIARFALPRTSVAKMILAMAARSCGNRLDAGELRWRRFNGSGLPVGAHAA